MAALLLQLTGILPVGVLLTVALITAWSSIENVPSHEKRALTVFGAYRRMLEPGIRFIPPFVSITYPIRMETQTLDIPQQEATTRDDSPVTVAATVDISVVDAEKAFLEVDDYTRAVRNISQVALRVAVQEVDYKDVGSNYGSLDRRYRQDLEEVTQEWGVRVEQVDVRNVDSTE